MVTGQFWIIKNSYRAVRLRGIKQKKLHWNPHNNNSCPLFYSSQPGSPTSLWSLCYHIYTINPKLLWISFSGHLLFFLFSYYSMLSLLLYNFLFFYATPSTQMVMQINFVGCLFVWSWIIWNWPIHKLLSTLNWTLIYKIII